MATYLSNIGETSRILSRARRVLVIGCSGSGKTTLARWLSLDTICRSFLWIKHSSGCPVGFQGHAKSRGL
ncbi:ABC-type polar amino acid transport system ATPase subunit [Sinorhizobium medicae]